MRFAPLFVVLLAIAATANLWSRFDLEHSDPAYYYDTARQYRTAGKFELGHLVFSPLYTGFLATMQRIVKDPFEVVVLQRMIIVAWCALAVFGVFRTILPLRWAWLGVFWWLMLPVNTRAFYEVHLFGFALLATGAWLAGSGRGPFRQGLALTCLALCGLLVRNEFLLATMLFSGAIAWSLWREYRTVGGAGTLKRVGWIMLPVVLTFGVLGGISYRSWTKLNGKGLSKVFKGRQSLNFSQVYAYGLKQRDATWQGDPWVGGDEVIQRDFGKTGIGFGEALKENPKALMGHAWWNVQLLPNGLEQALFGKYYGEHGPDFSPSRGGNLVALLGLMAVAAVCVAGAWQARKAPPAPWQGPAARWTWITLWCCVPSCVVAVLTQRPRPSYFFIATLLVMAWSLLWMARWMEQYARGRRWVGPAGAAAGACFFWLSVFRPPGPAPQPVAEDTRRLAPYAELLETKGLAFYSDVRGPDELMCYAYRGTHRRPKSAAFRPELLTAASATDGPVLVYLRNPNALAAEVTATWQGAGALGWRKIAGAELGKAPWVLLCNDSLAASPALQSGK